MIGALIPTVIGLGLQLQLANAFSAISSVFGWALATVIRIAVNLLYAGTFVKYTTMVPVGAVRKILKNPGVLARRGFLKESRSRTAAVLVVAGIAAQDRVLAPLQPTSSDEQQFCPDQSFPGSGRITTRLLQSDPRLSDLVGSEVTDNSVFYRVDINPIPPQLDINTWTLKIDGKVNNPLTLTKDSFGTLPSMVDEYANLECVSNTISPPGGLI